LRLSSQQIEQYRSNGFLSGLSIATDLEADEIRQHFDGLEQAEGTDKAQIGLLDRHFDQPFIYDLATSPAILDAIEQILGPGFQLLATHFFCKYGGGEKFVAWHQDVTYWQLDPPTALTVWYAVDDSSVENGCMRVIPGSHLDGIRHHGKSGQQGNLLSINQEVPVTPEEEASAVDLVLKAGQISIHDGMLVHGSLPNRSNRRRCGLTLRYVPAKVRLMGTPSTGRGWKMISVR
jgi:ectoine hydroxylase-related dioxygenase (phytanoyl-CoA dioxygenase family)